MNQLTRCLVLGSACILPACGSSAGTSGRQGGEGPTGSVSLDVGTLPSAIKCIAVTDSVAGANTTTTFNVSGATSPTLPLGLLPLGENTLTATAYTVACGNLAPSKVGWVADPVQVDVQPGVVPTVTFNFRPDNPVDAGTNFEGNVTQVVAGPAIGVVLSDGTVRAAGDLQGLYDAPAFTTLSLPPVKQMAVSSTGNFSCVVVTDGTVQCWGLNAQGELGNGTQTDSAVPVVVTGLGNVVQISLGQTHACAVDASGGVWCWGGNPNGMIGNGSTQGDGPPVTTPVQVLTDCKSVAAGDFDTCAVTFDGNVDCWGESVQGQLGNGTTTFSSTPTPVQDAFESTRSLGGITQAAMGPTHACAVQASGALYCWGSNFDGVLGNGNTTESSVPVPANISNVAQVAVTDLSTCARLNDGTVWCWGASQYGQLGNGTAEFINPNPTKVSSLLPSAAISAADDTICSLSTTQQLQCWGHGALGQFATGNDADQFVPLTVNF
jgi:Regulator of chromosome condensation (RCC1) repeat